jgi:CheY-like chemotaxis protein
MTKDQGENGSFSGPKKSILIVDDEKGIREMFHFLLQPEGFEVFTAQDGAEGLELVGKRAFDIIFLDMHMPKVEGPEALRRIRQIRPGQAVIIFSSSSDSNLTFESKAKEMGAVCCLYKPVDVDEILKVIELVIKGA